MTTLLLRNAHTLVTMNAAREELRDAAVLIRDNTIERVGKTVDLPASS